MRYHKVLRSEYIGSVRFFRHVIVGFVLITITFLSVTTVALSIKLAGYIGDGERGPISQAYASDKSANTPADNSNLNTSPFMEMSYQAIYPDMFSKTKYKQETSLKTVYLTFDDGPSPLTGRVLDILKAHNIKATFFVVGTEITTETTEIIKRMLDEGHTIGVHTTSHNYSQIYNSVESYLDDFYLTYDMIYQITGTYPEVFRFPGGSVNSYNSGIYTEIIAEMTRRGFAYYDWNVSAQDASSKATESTIIESSLKGLSMDSNVFILMHDTKEKSVNSLEQIIAQYEANGFVFNKLSKGVKGVSFAYR